MREPQGSKLVEPKQHSFSKSTTSDMQEVTKGAFGVQVVQQYEKYLGLPSFVGKNKKESFAHLKQRIWKKLQGWEVMHLS